MFKVENLKLIDNVAVLILNDHKRMVLIGQWAVSKCHINCPNKETSIDLNGPVL